MVPSAAVPKTHGPVPRVGRRVWIPRGHDYLDGRVIEDRGNLGAHGERLALVAVPANVPLNEATTFEVPVASLRLTAP
jgi:hypothetical protein